ncbi:AAA family ATPase [Desulfopila aestuarii]|uniref:Type II secretory pathway, component ExeA (Predicted ATPase) n=1 Tax=Desulfopila aestuarii DSM 18488 TaxID=1121416 RepID=A0A1M7Y335_9BACT|nr:AAA family ATPase [Desulfopila aestuarii]SHO46486.1 Type II secretory pathway, component ExeA (predicted ATPase) [Desulfopila aestuarii DSM 18488]
MYTSYFNLDIKPFQIASDPKFIWLGEKHKEALATLTYGVLDNKGFMLLTGDVGTGKTTLINALIKGLSEDVLYASVPDPRLELNDLLNYIANSFGIRKNFKSKGKFLIYFSEFLARCHQNKKQVLLLIDEAQLLTQDLLEEIRLLSNIQKDGLNLLNIFFVGQDEFNEILERPENRAVAQRLTLNYHLKPLTDLETEEYIKHRLSVAGANRQIFDAEAFMEIHRYSGGFPRRINILCDHCLLTGFVREQRVIGADVVRNCAHELKIPQYVGRQSYASPQRPMPPQFETPAPSPPVSPPPYTAPQVVPSVKAPVVSPAQPQPEGVSETEDTVEYKTAPPQRPILQSPNRSYSRPLIFFVALLFIGAGALYYFDRATFDTLYNGASRQLFELQERLTALDTAPRPVTDQSEPVGEKPKASDESQGNEPVQQQPETPGQQPAVPPQPVAPSPTSKKVAIPPSVEEKGTTVTVEPLLNSQNSPETGNPKEGTLSGIDPVSSEPVPQVIVPAATPVAQPVNELEVEQPVAQEAAPEPLETEASKRLGLLQPEPEVQKPLLPPVTELPKEAIVIRFNNDSSEFFFTDFSDVEGLVAAIRDHPEAILVISGHTDSFGSEGYNYRLSLFRANMVKSFFLGKGLPSHQLRVQAFGSEKPIASNDTTEGRSMNRRVEIEVLQ